MHRKNVIVLFLIVGIASLIAACGGAGSAAVSRVTPLPASNTTNSTNGSTTEEVAPTNTATIAPTATAQPATNTPAPAANGDAASNASSGSSVNVASSNASPTPQDNGLAPGESREIARATDIPMRPTVENPMTFDSFPVSLTFEEFYAGYDMRRGMLMTDKILSLDGQQVVIEGYVAPPLKPRIDFFVLTRIQLAFCPFCSADTEWPTDIALVYMPTQDILSTEYPVRVTGQLELGPSTDADSGMVSMIRIYAETVETIN